MSGFQNEINIINYLNTTPFNQLELTHQKLILKLNNNRLPQTITAKKYGGQDKADIAIVVDGIEYLFSIKKGSGNSVHQEPIEDFIKFLKTIDDNESVFNDLRFFIWGDNTLDGTGDKKNRLDANKLIKEHPDKIRNIQKYFDKHIDILIDRFVITGVKSKNSADYLWYGNSKEGITISKEDMIHIIKSEKKKPISIGILTFQAWNRNIKPDGKSEHKRGVVQLKWGTLKNDILNYYDGK